MSVKKATHNKRHTNLGHSKEKGMGAQLSALKSTIKKDYKKLVGDVFTGYGLIKNWFGKQVLTKKKLSNLGLNK